MLLLVKKKNNEYQPKVHTPTLRDLVNVNPRSARLDSKHYYVWG